MAVQRTAVGVAAIALALGFTSCATLPQLNTLPAVPTYGAVPLKCQTPSTCAVQEGPDYNDTIYRYPVGKDKRGQPIYSTVTLAPEILCRWTAEAVGGLGYTIYTPAGYVTRADRLKVDRVVVPAVRTVRQLSGREGHYTDVELLIMVFDARTGKQLDGFTVWGRTTYLSAKRVPSNLFKEIDAACLNAIANVTTLPRFQSDLTLPAAAAVKETATAPAPAPAPVPTP
jgi:hypothetical protein